VVGKEAGDMTQKGTLKVEMFELSRKLRDCYTDLGSKVYDLLYVKKKENWQSSKQVKSIVQKIRTTERRLKKKNLEYKKIGKGKKKKR
jgi:hypothetical protein